MKKIMITTEYRGVFCAQIEENADLTPRTLTGLKNARMVITWRNGEGLQGMANYGPTSNCKLSPISDIEVIHGVTAVFLISEEAAKNIWP
jgi:hypothetical protein